MSWNAAIDPAGRILDPERLSVLLEQLLERREEWVERRRSHTTELNTRATEAEAKLKRLCEAIGNGLINMADLSLKERIAELTAIRDQAQADAERAQPACASQLSSHAGDVESRP